MKLKTPWKSKMTKSMISQNKIYFLVFKKYSTL
jgi:hypothetical protein